LSAPLNASPAAGHTQRRAKLLVWAFVGAIVGVTATLAFTAWMRRDRLPTLTRDRMDAAEQRWKQKAPNSYTIEIAVSAREESVYVVEVVEGNVISASRNGTPIRQRHAWHTWSVPGMFDTLTSDIEHLEEKDMQIVVRCKFDENLGYPAQYERIQLLTASQVFWRVTRFEPH
jgi:hypothetical protein